MIFFLCQSNVGLPNSFDKCCSPVEESDLVWACYHPFTLFVCRTGVMVPATL